MKPPHLAHGKSSKASTPQENATLPFHVKDVKAINAKNVQHLAKGLPMEQRLNELLPLLTDASLHTPMTDKDIDATPVSKYTMKDIRELARTNQIEKVSRHEVKGTVVTFPVTEAKLVVDEHGKRKFVTAQSLPPEPNIKERRRGIACPRWDNDSLAYEAHMRTLTLQEGLEQGKSGDSASCADLTMSFSQYRFSFSVSRFHCFRDEEGQWWAFKVMLMGARYSCEIMHLTTEVLAYAKQNPLLKVGHTDGVRTQVHVDNVRFLHSNPFYVQDAMARFLSNCDHVNATVNMDADIQPHTFGTSFGVVHDYHANLAALSEKHLRKATQARKDLKGPMTVRRVCEIMGLLFFASTVLKIHLARFYFPIKWYRRIAHDFERGSRSGKPFGLDSVVTVWPSITRKFDQWLHRVGENVPTSHEKADPTITLFCDASKVGCGAVLIDGVRPSYLQYGESLSKKEYADVWHGNDLDKAISLLETKAATKAIHFFRQYLEGKTVRLYIDNTSLIGALGKTYSKSFALNGELLALIEEMEKTGASFEVQYVPSGENLADRPSRAAEGRRGPA